MTTCPICGALVDQRGLHAQWHEALPVNLKSLELASKRPSQSVELDATLERGVAAVRALHRQMVWPLCDCDPPHGQVFCGYCLTLSGRHPEAMWPCPTVRALEGAR